MRLFNNFIRILLPPTQAAAQRKDDIGMPTGRKNYHRRSIFELGPKGKWFLFSAIPTSHFMLWMPDTSRILSTSTKERFEMLKEVNLHRKHYNRKRSSNNSAHRPNSFIGSGTIPAIPKLGNKTECTKLHFLIISRSSSRKIHSWI